MVLNRSCYDTLWGPISLILTAGQIRRKHFIFRDEQIRVRYQGSILSLCFIHVVFDQLNWRNRPRFFEWFRPGSAVHVGVKLKLRRTRRRMGIKRTSFLTLGGCDGSHMQIIGLISRPGPNWTVPGSLYRTVMRSSIWQSENHCSGWCDSHGPLMRKKASQTLQQDNSGYQQELTHHQPKHVISPSISWTYKMVWGIACTQMRWTNLTYMTIPALAESETLKFVARSLTTSWTWSRHFRRTSSITGMGYNVAGFFLSFYIRQSRRK
jgi:hypothetical protein